VLEAVVLDRLAGACQSIGNTYSRQNYCVFPLNIAAA
jgi:hypothetical protein